MAETRKSKINIDEEERKRRSERAKQLVKEGKIGGRQKGQGRPRNPRAREKVAEAVKEDSEKIIRALRDGLKSKSEATRVKTALAMLDIEREEEEYQVREEQRKYDNISREKLLEVVREKIKELGIGDKITGFDFESTAKEVEQRSIGVKSPGT